MKFLFSALLALTALVATPVNAQMEPGQATTIQASPVADPSAKVTKTLERTTTKTYTLTKQKVGHVGGRPYPKRQETVDGGVTVEKFVNDAKMDTKVLKPDPMLDQSTDGVARQYHTDDVGVKAIGAEAPTNVKVRHVGNFND